MCLVYPPIESQHNYLAAIIDKHERLKNTKSPRIIFIGGSNLAFGLDSKQVEDSLNRNVVNMGLHAGIGLRFMLSEVKESIRSGDCLVIIPEYDHFFSLLDGERTLCELLITYPQAIHYITSREQILNLMRYHSQLLRQELIQWIKQKIKKNKQLWTKADFQKADYIIYQRYAFNAYGDMTNHIHKTYPEPIDLMPILEPPSQPMLNKSVTTLNEFYSMAISKHAQVFFMFSCIPDVRYFFSKPHIDDLYQFLQKHLYIPIIGSPEDSIFPMTDFYDTRYHLNQHGRSLHTQKIIECLQEVKTKIKINTPTLLE